MARNYVSRELARLGGRPVWRDKVVTDNGNHILDVHDLRITDPVGLETAINQIVGVVTVGLFAARPADLVILGGPAGIRRYRRMGSAPFLDRADVRFVSPHVRCPRGHLARWHANPRASVRISRKIQSVRHDRRVAAPRWHEMCFIQWYVTAACLKSPCAAPSRRTASSPLPGIDARLLRRYGVIAGGAAALLLLVVWSARAWLSSEKVIPRDRVRTAVVERGPFVRDVAATGIVVAAISPTLFAEAPGTIIYKVRAGDTVKAGDVLGKVESAALTNEYERERATLASTEAALNRQTIEVRRTILKSSQDTDLAKVQITAAEREFKRAEDAWSIHVIPERDFERARDDLETAKLNYAHAMETGGLEKDSLQLELRSQRAQRDAQALKVARLRERVDALTLKSPVAGMVATLSQPERAQVAENAPLVTVVDLTALEIEFQVSESYANEIRSGMNAEIALDGRQFTGTVAGISPDVRNAQVTGRVRFARAAQGPAPEPARLGAHRARRTQRCAQGGAQPLQRFGHALRLRGA